MEREFELIDKIFLRIDKIIENSISDIPVPVWDSKFLRKLQELKKEMKDEVRGEGLFIS